MGSSRGFSFTVPRVCLLPGLVIAYSLLKGRSVEFLNLSDALTSASVALFSPLAPSLSSKDLCDYTGVTQIILDNLTISISLV